MMMTKVFTGVLSAGLLAVGVGGAFTAINIALLPLVDSGYVNLISPKGGALC
ncbi:MAG: hypothetical protein RR587_10930 [Solibacillus sp.]